MHELSVSGDQATVDLVFTATHQGEMLGYAPTGNPLVLPIMGTYDVQDDVVTSFTLKYELSTVLAAITQES